MRNSLLRCSPRIPLSISRGEIKYEVLCLVGLLPAIRHAYIIYDARAIRFKVCIFFNIGCALTAIHIPKFIELSEVYSVKG